MDPVDILTMAAMAAQLIRSSADPERTIIGAYAGLGLDPPDDGDEPMAVRVARLVAEAGDRRGMLNDFLRSQAGPLPLNRTIEADPDALVEPDPEAVRLAAWVEGGDDEEGGDGGPVGFELFVGTVPPFRIAERSVALHFSRDQMREAIAGQAAAAGSPDDPALRAMADRELPVAVRGLIDDPTGIPVLFAIEAGAEPWDVWEICLAFADQYRKIYEQPDRYGVWGHDLTDLWIEQLLYYPAERLLYPLVGS